MWTELQDCLGFYDVTVRLTTLDVHDDCDNVSEGDWYVALDSEASPSANLPGDYALWPGTTEASSVDGGNSYSLGIENRLRVRGNATLRVGVGVVDCDGSPGAWFWPLVGVPIPPITSEIAAYESALPSVDCSDQEEWIEYSGGNDYLGMSVREFSPADWKQGVTFTIRGDAQAKQACESSGSPYTAHLEIQARKRP